VGHRMTIEHTVEELNRPRHERRPEARE
jgi:hypothetical protein